jgi:hypothetical protein
MTRSNPHRIVELMTSRSQLSQDLPMLKLTSLVFGLLTVIAIAPNSQAASVNGSTIANPTGELHAEGFHREMRQDRHEIHRERRDVRHDRREMRQHRRDVRHDRHEMRRH